MIPHPNSYLNCKYVTHTCIKAHDIDMMQIDLSTSQHPGPPYLRPSETQPNYIFLNCKMYLCDESENVFVKNRKCICTPRSPLLATQRNPAHRMMSPGPIGMRPYNLPYNKCSRNM